MAATTAPDPTFSDEKIYLLVRIAGDLAPNLANKPRDRDKATGMALRMVRAYHPSSEAEFVGAARIVSLSMMQLDLLREATKPDLTPSMKLKYVNAAANLNRAICHNERALERRQLAEERRHIALQEPEPARINRSSNQAAIDRAAHPGGAAEPRRSGGGFRPQMAEAHVRHHEALRTAAPASPQGARPPGAGSPPPTTRAASPG